MALFLPFCASLDTKDARFGMLMSIYLAVLCTTTGNFPLMQFTALIFSKSGSSLHPNDSAIVVAVLQSIGSYSSAIFVDKIGRKPLLLLSCGGAGISLSLIGAYTYLSAHGFSMDQWNWIPLVCYAMGIFLLSIGVMSLSLGVMAEILPPEVLGQNNFI